MSTYRDNTCTNCGHMQGGTDCDIQVRCEKCARHYYPKPPLGPMPVFKYDAGMKKIDDMITNSYRSPIMNPDEITGTKTETNEIAQAAVALASASEAAKCVAAGCLNTSMAERRKELAIHELNIECYQKQIKKEREAQKRIRQELYGLSISRSLIPTPKEEKQR